MLAPAVVGRSDASAVEVNPAALAQLRSWSLRLVHSEMRKDGRIQGTGTAFFAAAPLSLYRRLVFGTSVQWIRPVDAIGYPDTVKLSLAAALRIRPWLTFGLGYHRFFAEDSAAIDDLNTLDVGLVVTPLTWLSLGLSLRNVTTPDFAGLPLQRVYDIEAALRPLRNRRLELALGVRIGERRARFDPRVRLRAFIARGFEVFARAEMLWRDFERNGGEKPDLRVSTGLEVSFERLSVAIAGVFGRSFSADSSSGPIAASSGTRSGLQGGQVAVELRGERRTPLFETKRKLLVLSIGKKLDARKLVALHGVLVRLKNRRDVSGVLIRLEDTSMGWATAQELVGWIHKLRAAKKKVAVYLEATGMRGYYVASAADAVWLDPAGQIMLSGVVSSRMYLRGLFEKLSVKPNFVRIAEYKTAPESFTRTGPSKQSLQVRNSLLDQIYNALLVEIARARKLTVNKVRELVDRGPFVPSEALSAKLVDALVPPAKLNQKAARWAGAKVTSPSKIFRRWPRWHGDPKIAVIAIEGDIVRGKSSTVPLLGTRVVGDKTIVAALDWARGRSSVRAVVLRIDSPGGSAFASDHIWRAVRRLRKKKPVIVSMGDVAASGGYFAAAGGHQILAMPATITGSIGIYVGKFDLSGLLTRVGVNIDVLTRGKRALLRAFTRSFSEEERKVVKKRLRYYYNAFVSAVAAGRPLSAKQVDAVARGRVWSGEQAKKVKLVDRLGSLSDAIITAKKRAGLSGKHARLVVLPSPKKSLLTRALGLLSRNKAQVTSSAIPPIVRSLFRSIPPALWYARVHEPLMRLPYTLQRLAGAARFE
jgi:protease-4